MAALSDANRIDTMRQFARKAFQDLGATANMTTADIKSAVDALDDWLEANITTLNAAFPLPFRTTASTQQKALILSFVAMKKGGLI